MNDGCQSLCPAEYPAQAFGSHLPGHVGRRCRYGRPGKGEKKQKKKEALVGVKYGVNANVRTAKEVATKCASVASCSVVETEDSGPLRDFLYVVSH